VKATSCGGVIERTIFLKPEWVTERMGIQPTHVQTKGQTSTNSIGRRRTAPIGGWFLSSEGHVASRDTRRHLDWLVALILPRGDALREIQCLEGIKMNVNCIWWSAHGDGGPTLWPEQMRALAALDLECSFEISFFGEDEPQSDGVS
jgi:hypothetical protein